MLRRSILLLLPCLAAMAAPVLAQDDPWTALKPDGIVLFRHANAPGVGDPAGFTLGDCATQRNLDERGREQARAIGAAFRAKGVTVGKVLTSQWCRSRETAELAFPGQAEDEPAFNSFFAERDAEPAATEAARNILVQWKGHGVLVVVTHQVNITALTGVTPASGEGIVVRAGDGTLSVKGRLRLP